MTTLASFSSTQSRPVSPASRTPSSTYRAISCALISMQSISGSSMAGKVRAAAGGDVETRFAKQINGRVFETAFGKTQLQLHFVPP